jgi:hypothetical protein
MPEEKDKSTQKDQETIKPADKQKKKGELSDKDLGGASGGMVHKDWIKLQ